VSGPGTSQGRFHKEIRNPHADARRPVPIVLEWGGDFLLGGEHLHRVVGFVFLHGGGIAGVCGGKVKTSCAKALRNTMEKHSSAIPRRRRTGGNLPGPRIIEVRFGIAKRESPLGMNNQGLFPTRNLNVAECLPRSRHWDGKFHTT